MGRIVDSWLIVECCGLVKGHDRCTLLCVHCTLFPRNIVIYPPSLFRFSKILQPHQQIRLWFNIEAMIWLLLCVCIFSAPINLSFHSSVQHGQGCCNLDDHGRLAVHAASVIVIRRRLLSNGRGGSKSAWWSIWWSSSIENWNAYFFGRRPVYLVFCSAYRCSRQMPRRIMGTYFMWGTRGAWWDFWSGRGFGEKRGQGTYTEVNLVHILLGGWCRCIL